MRLTSTSPIVMDLETLLSALATAITARKTLPTNTLTTGSFLTTSIRSSDESSHRDESTVQLTSSPDSPYIILLGLNMLNFAKCGNLRIEAEVTDKSRNSFHIVLKSHSDSIHHSSGCSWLRVNYDDPDIQVGHFSTIDDHPWYEPKETTERKITFPRRYETPPNVVVWFTLLDSDRNNHCRAHVFAKDITPEGFTLCIKTWAGSKLYVARTGWFAHSSGRPDICSGNFSTQKLRRTDRDLRSETSSDVSFDAGFIRPPKVFTALNLVEMSNVADFRVKLWPSNITATGMTWHIGPWGSAELPQASGAYIAFDNDVAENHAST